MYVSQHLVTRKFHEIIVKMCSCRSETFGVIFGLLHSIFGCVVFYITAYIYYNNDVNKTGI